MRQDKIKIKDDLFVQPLLPLRPRFSYGVWYVQYFAGNYFRFSNFNKLIKLSFHFRITTQVG